MVIPTVHRSHSDIIRSIDGDAGLSGQPDQP